MKTYIKAYNPIILYILSKWVFCYQNSKSVRTQENARTPMGAGRAGDEYSVR